MLSSDLEIDRSPESPEDIMYTSPSDREFDEVLCALVGTLKFRNDREIDSLPEPLVGVE